MKEQWQINCEYSKVFESDKWRGEIPYLQFPQEWKIKIVPPNMAVVRFIVEHNNKRISVYLDCYDILGCVGEPYWEIYPYEEDTFRCLMNETDELLEAIKKGLI